MSLYLSSQKGVINIVFSVALAELTELVVDERTKVGSTPDFDKQAIGQIRPTGHLLDAVGGPTGHLLDAVGGPTNRFD